ncbi:RSP_7527 family protein [Falsigemmobacter intermedius]|uniref:RSP_7527 family protein n=1 Tax=Falsigemmobacter intermedius TaxID=1553448 RepID=UPI003F0F8792
MTKSISSVAPLSHAELTAVIREARAHRARVLAAGVSSLAQRLRALFGAASQDAHKGHKSAV